MKRERDAAAATAIPDSDDNDDDDDDDHHHHHHHRPPPPAFTITPDQIHSCNPNPNHRMPSLNNPYKHHHHSSNKEQDRFLPIANVGRIMKKVIPGNGKISKDAKETVQECVSEFISFVTGEASDKCQREKRKTINGDDILWAIMTLGFEDYVNPLKLYLTKYREIEGEKLNIPKQHQQQHQHQHRVVEQHMQHDQNINMPYSSVYPNPNLIPQPSFVSNDPPFSLPFSSNSIQTTTLPAPTLPQQDHLDDHW
ncbi:nuclear transcription factor Y subunit B-7 [Andrographis paniculata]|uniref:nuclear transcription factor Y subunit B-7 n=1 Tax=Andrographis paniculata TaxID=175694 RepID=UPI0021E9A4F1|nr:nuclear transcription factor Y subunit B-7 [Andrographis paniculata]